MQLPELTGGMYGGRDGSLPGPVHPQNLVSGGGELEGRVLILSCVYVSTWLATPEEKAGMSIWGSLTPSLSLAQPMVVPWFMASATLDPTVLSMSTLIWHRKKELGGACKPRVHLLIHDWQQHGARVLGGMCPAPVGWGDSLLHPEGQHH